MRAVAVWCKSRRRRQSCRIQVPNLGAIVGAGTRRPPRRAQAAHLGERSPHHPHRVLDAAAAAGTTLAFLPFRSPELSPLEERWRGLKQTVAANRCYPSLDELTQRTVTWLDDTSDVGRLRRCGCDASNSIGYLRSNGHESHRSQRILRVLEPASSASDAPIATRY